MATENIPQIDRLIKNFGKQFQEDIKQVNKTLEQAGKAIKKYREREEKTILHNVTVKHEESKVLEQYWVMQAIQKDFQTDCMITCAGIFAGKGDKLLDSKELNHKPTPNEIAQFLYESHADFVSVVQNYRFENELPFC